jgi:drug/metabolite transporter (DMT)-like permease
MNKILGIILIALGLFGIAWGGFTYTTRQKVVDIGPIQASRDVTHHVPLPPIAGAVALVAGVVLLVASGKK